MTDGNCMQQYRVAVEALHTTVTASMVGGGGLGVEARRMRTEQDLKAVAAFTRECPPVRSSGTAPS